MYPIPLGCGVYPIRRGLGFYAPQQKARSLRSALRQTKTKEPNNVLILNMTQLQSANKEHKPPNTVLHGCGYISPKIIPIRCNGDVNVTVINLKAKIDGCNGSREDGILRHVWFTSNPSQTQMKPSVCMNSFGFKDPLKAKDQGRKNHSHFWVQM